MLSDAEARAIIEAANGQSRTDPNETAGVYYAQNEGAVDLKRNEGDIHLASIPAPPSVAVGAGGCILRIATNLLPFSETDDPPA